MESYRHRIALLGIVGANVLALRAASQFGPAAFRPVAEAQSALLAMLSALLPSPLTGALLLVAYFGAECLAGCFGGRWPWDRATWSPSIWAASLLPICLVFRGIGLMGLPNATLSRRLNSHQFSLADAGRFTTLQSRVGRKVVGRSGRVPRTVCLDGGMKRQDLIRHVESHG